MLKISLFLAIYLVIPISTTLCVGVLYHLIYALNPEKINYKCWFAAYFTNLQVFYCVQGHDFHP